MAKYFQREEFDCPCCGENNISLKLIGKLDQIRGEIKIPIIVTSGYRCRKHNTKVMGVDNSRHLSGLAADITTHNFRKDMYSIMEWAVILGFKGIGINEKYIHLDLRDKKTMWLY